MASNSLLVRWNRGWSVRTAPNGLEPGSRREAVLSLGAATSSSEAFRVADQVLNVFRNPRTQINVDFWARNDAEDACTGWIPGDSVWAPDKQLVPTRYRVMSCAFDEDDDGYVTVAPTLNDVVLERQDRVATTIKKMSNGTVGGTSSAATAISDTGPPPSCCRQGLRRVKDNGVCLACREDIDGWCGNGDYQDPEEPLDACYCLLYGVALSHNGNIATALDDITNVYRPGDDDPEGLPLGHRRFTMPNFGCLSPDSYWTFICEGDRDLANRRTWRIDGLATTNNGDVYYWWPEDTNAGFEGHPDFTTWYLSRQTSPDTATILTSRYPAPVHWANPTEYLRFNPYDGMLYTNWPVGVQNPNLPDNEATSGGIMVRIHPITGVQTELFRTGVGSGYSWSQGIPVFDAHGGIWLNRALFLDNSEGGLYRYDMRSGELNYVVIPNSEGFAPVVRAGGGSVLWSTNDGPMTDFGFGPVLTGRTVEVWPDLSWQYVSEPTLEAEDVTHRWYAVLEAQSVGWKTVAGINGFGVNSNIVYVDGYG